MIDMLGLGFLGACYGLYGEESLFSITCFFIFSAAVSFYSCFGHRIYYVDSSRCFTNLFQDT
jgi:hypothetical protein